MVDPKGNHGVYTLEKALEMAQLQNLDLVEIAPHANPPVCKIMDYGKFQYEQKKKEKDARKRQSASQLKEVRFRPGTDRHDFDFKVKHAREFLTEGHKVRAYVQFRGRDIIYKERGMAMIQRFIEAVKDISTLDQEPRMEGRRMTAIITPIKVRQ